MDRHPGPFERHAGVRTAGGAPYQPRVLIFTDGSAAMLTHT